jgi:hypothetical protein
MRSVKSRAPIVTLDINGRESVTQVAQPPRARGA